MMWCMYMQNKLIFKITLEFFDIDILNLEYLKKLIIKVDNLIKYIKMYSNTTHNITVNNLLSEKLMEYYDSDKIHLDENESM